MPQIRWHSGQAAAPPRAGAAQQKSHRSNSNLLESACDPRLDLHAAASQPALYVSNADEYNRTWGCVQGVGWPATILQPWACHSLWETRCRMPARHRARRTSPTELSRDREAVLTKRLRLRPARGTPPALLMEQHVVPGGRGRPHRRGAAVRPRPSPAPGSSGRSRRSPDRPVAVTQGCHERPPLQGATAAVTAAPTVGRPVLLLLLRWVGRTFLPWRSSARMGGVGDLYSTLLYSTLLYSTLLCSALFCSVLFCCPHHFPRAVPDMPQLIHVPSNRSGPKHFSQPD